MAVAKLWNGSAWVRAIVGAKGDKGDPGIVIDEGSGFQNRDVLIYDGNSDLWVPGALTTEDVEESSNTKFSRVYSDATDRDASILSPQTGMIVYLGTEEVVEVYDGSAWTAVGATPGVLQVVSTTKTDTFATTSSTYVDITDLSVTLTPASAASKILILFYGQVGNSNQNDSTFIQFVRDSTAVFIGDAAGNRTRASTGLYWGNVGGLNGINFAAPATFVDSPATTASVTYKAQMRISGNAGTNTAYLGRIGANDTDNSQRGRFPSSLIAVEISG